MDYPINFGELYDFVAESEPNKIRGHCCWDRVLRKATRFGRLQKTSGLKFCDRRNVENREKKVDTGIVAAMIKDAYTRISRKNDTISLVAGDSDYVPAVRMLVADGFHVEVVFWSSVSWELKKEASKFIELDKHLETLKYD